MKNQELSDKEKLFCELYAAGDGLYAGNAEKCYETAFSYPNTNSLGIKAKRLLAEERIQKYLEELEALTYQEGIYMKKFLTQNLKQILAECGSREYRDRRGTVLSPAPLRSVAVNAAKALMEMYPVKEAQTSKINIGSEGESGIVFNVIVPEQNKKEESDK